MVSVIGGHVGGAPRFEETWDGGDVIRGDVGGVPTFVSEGWGRRDRRRRERCD